MTKKIFAISIFIIFFTARAGMASASDSTDENLTINGTFRFTTSPVAGYVLTSDGTGLASWAAGAIRLDQITAATALNVPIANGVNSQVWNWALNGADTAFTFGETTAATGANNAILKINTLNTSTALPLVITNNAVDKMYVSAQGNDLYLNANGSITDIAEILFTGTAGTGDFRVAADGGDIYWQGGGSRALQMGAYWPTVLMSNSHDSNFPAFLVGQDAGINLNTSVVIQPYDGTGVAAARPGDKALVVRGVTGQTGNLTEWQESNGYLRASVSASGVLTLGSTGANGIDGSLIISSEQGATDYSITFNPNAAMTQNVTYTLPADDGNNGEFLMTNGSGALSWVGGGWHGSTSRIKILPSDFISNDDDADNQEAYEDDDAGKGVRSTVNGTELYAFIPIPTGYTATYARIYGSDTDTVTVYASDITNGTWSASLGSAATGTEINITDTASTATNFLVILVATNATTDVIYGGYVTISKN